MRSGNITMAFANQRREFSQMNAASKTITAIATSVNVGDQVRKRKEISSDCCVCGGRAELAKRELKQWQRPRQQ